MRIATFNINGINSRLANLLAWLTREEPDVVCLQELKATDRPAAVAGVIIAGLYLPNGNPIKSPKFAYKLAWFESLIAHARGLFAAEAPVVLAGDFNVVPTDVDIYNPKSWVRDALLQPQSRACYARLLAQGWTDALRAQLNPHAAPRLEAAGVDTWVRGQPHASDHAPTWIELGATKPRKQRRTRAASNKP